jgi:formylglycine-generating enzyme required for sulfatase activity
MTSKFALVIANTDYQDENLAKLAAPGRDAEDFANVLRNPQFAGFETVQVLLNKGNEQIRRAIAHFFADRKSSDLLLLYFSGHGVRNEQGQLFLAAEDTDLRILEAAGIPSEFITHTMSSSRSHRQVLILDCCNSGAFDHGAMKASNRMGMAEAFGNGFGRVVLTATDAIQFAWEGDKIIGNTQNSVFTHFLIEGLKGAADQNGDGRITVDELYDYTFDEVVKHTPKQTPCKWSYKQQGEIYLCENLVPREVKPEPLTDEDEKLKREAEEKAALQKAEYAAQVKAKREADEAAVRERARREQQQVEAAQKAIRDAAPKAVQKKHVGYSLPVALGGFGLLFLVGAFAVAAFFVVKWLLPPVTPAPTEAPMAIESPAQEPIVLPAATEPPVVDIPTEAPILNIGSTMTGADGMVMLYVPAGEFTMGSNKGDPDEKPVHVVNLDAFWIDQTEVTNKMYSMCVAAGACEQPAHMGSATHGRYYDSLEFDNYPVIYVDWEMAKDYCQWAGRDLPTEAQWEKAARGTNASAYPWGDTFDGTRLNFCDASCSSDWSYELFDDDYAEVSPVGNYPTGQSVYGALDMAGNVWEWVNDWYDVYPGGTTTSSKFGQKYRVLRGGSWFVSKQNVRSADRYFVDLGDSFNYFSGFRCASTP